MRVATQSVKRPIGTCNNSNAKWAVSGGRRRRLTKSAHLVSESFRDVDGIYIKSPKFPRVGFQLAELIVEEEVHPTNQLSCLFSCTHTGWLSVTL